MRRTFAVLNQKGGVGKTTVTLGLASAAAAAGRRVLVVDLDPQASSSWVLGIDTAELDRSAADLLAEKPSAARSEIRSIITASTWSDLVEVLPSTPSLQQLESGRVRRGQSPDDTRGSKRLRRALREIEDDYEAVIIDCPPSLGNLTRSALTAARHALVVVEPSALGLRGIGGVADLIDDVWDATNPRLELSGVILNRVPAVSNEASRRIDELARIVGHEAIWSPPIPQRVIFNQAIGERRPIHSYGSRASEPVTVIDALWRRARGALRDGMT